MATNAAPEKSPAARSRLPPNPLVTAALPAKLSAEFALIIREFEVETVTLRGVLHRLHGRGYLLLLMLLALPFCTPIPLPGLSTPLGLIIALIGTRLALGAKPWLPARLLDTRLPPAIFARTFTFTEKIVRGFERFLHPRLPWVTASPRLNQLHAIPIVICAVLLLLPLPIPFTNTVPAWGILLTAGGLLERDGRFIIGGYATTFLSLIFFSALAFFGVETVDALWRWLR